MRIERLLNALAALATSAAVAACGSSTDGGAAAASVAITGSDPVTLTALNQTSQLGAQVLDANGSPIAGASVTWARTSGFSVTVTTGGLVTAVLAGSSVLTATSGGLTDNVTVNVTQAPFSMTKTGGDNQSGLTSAALGTMVRVRVSDALGSAIPNVTVNFAAGNGGAAAPPTDPTDNSGEAQTTWTLGAGAGGQTLTATVPGTALTATFGATATAPGQPTAMTAIAGAGQTALVGFATNVKPAVRVVDATTTAVQGVPVTFTVTGGGGSGNQVVNTDANGVAQMTNWVMGVGAGPNTLSASITASGVTGNPVAFTATAQTAQYNIEVRNIGPAFSPAVQAALNSAEAFWESAIYGELSNVSINTNDACGLGATINETVDDLIILAEFDSIDGPLLILGSASLCSIRGSNALPIYGFMRFDTADVAMMIADGSLQSVIRHEMGHVLGFAHIAFNVRDFFGVTAPDRRCLQLPSSPGGPFLDTHFNCTTGGGTVTQAIFDSIGGTTYTGGNTVPIENCVAGVPGSCGASSGTMNSHWREITFDTELMTGYLDPGSATSVLTIAAFGDIGYQVNYGAAQPYTQVFTAPRPFAIRRGIIDLSGDAVLVPVVLVDDATGRIRAVYRP